MGAMAAMACEGERADGPLSEESLTRRIFDSVLGKRTQRERSPSPLPAPSATPTEEVSLRKLREVYARAVKRKVGPQQYVDRSSSESELEDEFDSEQISGSESSEEEEASDGEDLSDSADEGEEKEGKKEYVCKKCGISVKKPALLIQHMRSHSDQKPFVCPERDCGCAYKRKDHLNRHMKKHQGVLYFCPQPGCDEKFTVNSNLQRHLKHHDERKHSKSVGEKIHVCSWPDCGMAFKYPSLLQTHKGRVHEKLEYAELICIYPGCGDQFSSEKALVEHAETCHPYLLCEVCGETIPRKSFLRHARTHGARVPCEVVCPHDGCGKTYTRESNLRVHVRSVHLNLKPFTCSHEGCNKTYAHKSALDGHGQSGVHSLPTTDFGDRDELLLSRPRGGRKKIAFDKVETYLKKKKDQRTKPVV
ncbi:unnamed protein product [Calypogeia fissa]